MDGKRIYVGGHFKGVCDDEEKIRRMEERATWHGRPVYEGSNHVSVGRRR